MIDTIDKELVAVAKRYDSVVTQRDALAAALRGMLDNYIELKRITLAVARSDSPNWLGCQMTPEDDIHVKAARAALAALAALDQ